MQFFRATRESLADLPGIVDFMNAIEAAGHFGIDLTLVEESLRLTPEERALQHQRALELAIQMQAAYRARTERGGNDRAQSTSADPVRR
jgi:hypothetical protein